MYYNNLVQPGICCSLIRSIVECACSVWHAGLIKTLSKYVEWAGFILGRWKKCVVLPLAIVKRGRATPWTYKKGVATPWTCNKSLIKPNGFYSIRCSTFTHTPKQSKEIDPPLSVKYLLKRKQSKKIKTRWLHHKTLTHQMMSTREQQNQHQTSPKTTNLLRICSNVECVTLPLCCHLKRVGLPVAIIFYA